MSTGEPLYVVRCSIVGPERAAPQMPLADACRLADDYNDSHCKGKHTVEPAEALDHETQKAQDR